MQRLSSKTLKDAAGQVARPLAINPPVGIVHLGSGAFHRAHQVVYTEDAMAIGGGDWGICGVSLRSAGVQQALQPQDCLYTLAVLDQEISHRIIGTMNSILVAPKELQAVLKVMASPRTHIFTMTVTEKGYCLNLAGDLNTKHPDIEHDLQTPQLPASAIGIMVEALRRRFMAGIAPPTIISCDNLANNGYRLANAVIEFAGLTNKETVHWIEDAVCFPSTMVDSITPATDDTLRDSVAQEIGLKDMLPVQRESFRQWVVENHFSGPKPEWEAAGVVLTGDVAPYENAKLRLLNATHSALAYLGSLMGIETVFLAMQNQTLACYIHQLVESEIAPTVKPLSGLKVSDYAAAILQRYKNPAIKHNLSQIAWDGSLKIPIRILTTLTENLVAGRSISLLCIAIAGWMHFVRTRAVLGQELSDPLAEKLLKIGTSCTLDAAGDVSRFMALEEIFNRELSKNFDFLRGLTSAYQALGDGTAASVTHALRMK